MLLILIYRSPIFWLIPFLSVIVAEVSSRGLGYVLSELGVTVTGQTSSILTVLVFGAGTDYALLIVARYREELRHQEDKHAARGHGDAQRRPTGRRVGRDGDGRPCCASRSRR